MIDTETPSQVGCTADPRVRQSDEEFIMAALRKAGFSSDQMKALTVEWWKGDAKIDRPAYPLLGFIEIIRYDYKTNGPRP